MTALYIALLTVATIAVSATGAYFSVKGLTELFAGAALSVAVMASSLEFAKFVSVGVLYRYWGHINKLLRYYLVFAVCTLMIITSAGIYGYLSNAYHIAAEGLHAQLLVIDNLEQENARIEAQINEFNQFIANIPMSRITRKIEMQKEMNPKIARLRQQSEKVIVQINTKKTELISTNTKVGPAVHLAKFIGVSLDTAVNILIVIFVLVFDPMAISLVFCLNLLLRLREKYRGNEYKIGAHSLTTPVDHRYRRAG
jgi:hypothetical protein